jgi:hypothetical protein
MSSINLQLVGSCRFVPPTVHRSDDLKYDDPFDSSANQWRRGWQHRRSHIEELQFGPDWELNRRTCWRRVWWAIIEHADVERSGVLRGIRRRRRNEFQA